ncbi:hypothetical protein [Vibrio hepatarius]|uniref:hypothetical protein n=1 Tax=Vibrio hepatarius TaxID=171383 RepID=UPI001C0979D7|nr:hypothetical protein [Vibrio hepatarius]MBU2895318.1 hypothetical protein [Vibrio hepatarius]
MIEEIQICGTGQVQPNNWHRSLQFKVDGKWFGTWADYYGPISTDYENNLATSMIYMTFSQGTPVHVKATTNWHPLFEKCGVSDGRIFNSNAGDFIRISR